jgi:hypothetical protein
VTLDRISGDRTFIVFGGTPGTDDGIVTSVHSAVLAQHGRTLAGAPTAEVPPVVPPLPPCRTAADVENGRWVRTWTTVGMFDNGTSPWYAPGSDVLRANFYTDFNAMLAWLPYACVRERVVDAPAMDRCLTGRAFNWHGDSQTRTLFNSAMWRLCGIAEPASNFLDLVPQCVRARERGGSDGCRMRTSCYVRELFGQDATESQLAEADVLVTNIGQWSASGPMMGGQAPASRYSHEVRRYLLAMPVDGAVSFVTGNTDPTTPVWTSDVGSDGLFVGVFPTLMRLAARRAFSSGGGGDDAPSRDNLRHVMWMETSPFPVRNDEVIASFLDWRTPHRLRLFNIIARRWWAEGLRQLRQFAALVELEVQRRGSGNPSDTDGRSALNADRPRSGGGIHKDPADVGINVHPDGDGAVETDVSMCISSSAAVGCTSTQRVLVSYIPVTARYTPIVESAADFSHLTHPDALDVTTDEIFAAIRRC